MAFAVGSSSSLESGAIEPLSGAGEKTGSGDDELLEIVRRARGGETLSEIARSRMPEKRPGAARVALYRFLLGGLGDEKYHDLVTELLVSRVAEADEGLELADDRVEVSKRKAIANFARTDLERRRPALYGPKQEVKHSGHAPTLHITIVEAGAGGRVFDGTPVPSAAGMLPPPEQIEERQGEQDEQEGHRGQAVGAG